MDDLQFLTDDERTYFSAFDSMFASDGWRQLLKEYENENRTLPEETFWAAADWDTIVRARIRLTLLLELEHYEDIVERRKADKVHERRTLMEDAQAEQSAAI